MFHRITSTLFNAMVVLAGASLAVWMTLTGHTLLIGGLLVAMAAVLAAVIFSFRLAEGGGNDRLSIWAGPLAPVANRHEPVREVA